MRELTQKQSGTLSTLDRALKKSPHALLKQIDHEGKTHLVAYFYNAQSGDLYLYALSPESWQIQTANLPYKLIGDFMDIVKNGPVQQAQELTPEFLTDFAQRARELYSRLLEPLFGDSPPERLLLLPDGSLGDLPFDLLLYKTPQTDLDFRKLPYLLRCSVTRLAPSVSALLMPRPPASGDKRWGYLASRPITITRRRSRPFAMASPPFGNWRHCSEGGTPSAAQPLRRHFAAWLLEQASCISMDTEKPITHSRSTHG